MFIAMNRFKITLGRETAFEDVWRNRDTYLGDIIGFRSFYLLRGPSNEEYTLYCSHSTWDYRRDFEDWTKSEAFRKAHENIGSLKGTLVGPPQFEGFEGVE